MKITKVEAIELRLPEEQVLPVPSGVQDALIVKIETDELIENRKRFKGVLNGVNDSDIEIEMDNQTYTIPFSAVSKAKIILTDELLAKWEAEHPMTEEIIED